VRQRRRRGRLMKIIETIQNLADAINNLASSLRHISLPSKNDNNLNSYTKTNYYVKNLPNNSYTKTSTSAEITYTTPPDFVTILKSEHEVIGRLYKALTSKDPDKADNDKVLLEIKTRWPKLYNALIDVVTAKTFSIYKGFSDEQK
jgi:hypothetical protein